MARRSRFVRPLHTCHFTPLQLQPAAALRLSMDALTTCINHQLRDWRVMIREYDWSLVVVGFVLRWHRPFTFYDATNLECDCGLRTRKDNQLLELEARFMPEGEDEPVLTVDTLWHPVALSGGEALDALPCKMQGEVLAMLQPDELEPSAPPRIVPGMCVELRSTPLVAETVTPFLISRDECEVADQWQNIGLAAFVGRAREGLAFEGRDPRLRRGLSQPLVSISAELHKPMYLHGDGEVHTCVYEVGGSLAYIHEVRGTLPGPRATERPLCATVIEKF